MQSAITLVFENNEIARLGAELFSNEIADAEFISLPTLTSRLLSTPLDEADRRMQLLELLPEREKERVDAWLFTLEKLRESLILTHDDVDFCFSVLPPTPRHLLIQKTLHEYLDSTLAEDWTAQVWHLRDQLQDGTLRLPAHMRQLIFVQSSPSNFLFPEIAGAVQRSQPDILVSTRWMWEIIADTPAGKAPMAGIRGRTGEISLRLAQHLQHKLNRGTSPDSLLIAFAGGPVSLEWLCCSLEKEKVPYRHFIDYKSSALQSPLQHFPLSRILEATRGHVAWPLKRRLVISSLILQQAGKVKTAEDWEGRLSGWEDRLQPAEIEWLRHFSRPNRPEPPKRAEVKIVPLSSLPSPALFSTFVFCDSDAFQGNYAPLLLREADLMTLEKNGFTLPKLFDHRAHLRRIFKMLELDHAKSRWVFSSHPRLERELTLRWRSLPMEKSETIATATESYQLDKPPVKRMSATQLEVVAKCPSQYFFRHLIRALPDENWEDRYYLILGRATHTALEKFFLEAPNRDLLSQDKPKAMEILKQLFDEALTNECPSLLKGSAKRLLWSKPFTTFANRIPEIEMQLKAVLGSQAPIALERKFDLKVEGIEFTGVIDRIDQRADGTLLIFDYKTGSVDFSPEQMADGRNFQALIYWLATEETFKAPVAGMLFYDLKSGEVRRGILKESRLPKEAKKAVTRGHMVADEKFQNLMVRGLERVSSAAKNIAAGNFSPTPASPHCDYCDYAGHCRKGLGRV